MHTRDKPHHGGRGTLPHGESEIEGATWDYHVIIDRENGVRGKVLDWFEPVVQIILFVDAKREIGFVRRPRLGKNSVLEESFKAIRRRIAFAPNHMYRIRPSTRSVMSYGLLKQRIPLPCVDKHRVAATPEIRLRVSTFLVTKLSFYTLINGLLTCFMPSLPFQ